MIFFLNLSLTEVMKQIENLSPFIQGILGSFVFVVLVCIMRFLLNLSKNTGKSAVKFWGMSRLAKYYLHKNMVNSTDNLYYCVFGNFLMIQKFLMQLTIGVLIIVFYLSVNSLINKDYFSFFVFFLAFNSFYEAFDWLKDHSDEKSILNVNEELKNEFFKTFGKYKKNALCDTEDKEQKGDN